MRWKGRWRLKKCQGRQEEGGMERIGSGSGRHAQQTALMRKARAMRRCGVVVWAELKLVDDDVWYSFPALEYVLSEATLGNVHKKRREPMTWTP
jgi:hypothetical protein